MLITRSKHQCPLCDSYEGVHNQFCWNTFIQQSICLTCCRYELWFGFYLCESEFESPGFPNAIIVRALQITGLRFQQAKFTYFRDYFNDGDNDMPGWDEILDLDPNNLSDEELRAWNRQMEEYGRALESD